MDLQPARAPEDPAGRRTRWRLDVGEQGELNRAVVAWLDSGEDFTVFLRRMRAVWADNPALGRLAAYFDGSEASKYGGRLYAHPQNGELRASLVEALGERVDRLPAPILAAVTAGEIE